MDRRTFLQSSASAAGMLTAQASGFASMVPALRPVDDVHRHRFGVNYTPSHRWWFCWADWDPSPMQKDLDAIAELGADHLRIMLIWPYFQPNLTWVDPRMLDRLSQLLTWMNQRHLDALITIFTGQLSGWFFLPPFNQPNEGFFTGKQIKAAQHLFLDSVATVVRQHSNVIGLDLGNEINTCWSAPIRDGDEWMHETFHVIERAMPGHLNVNGVDQQPWFRDTTFSPHALVAQQRMPVMHCYPYWSGALKYGGPMDPPSVKLLAGMAALIRAYAGSAQKPVWAGEFNTCIASLSEKQQAQWLEKAVLASIGEGVNWFSYWDSHDLNRKFTFNPVEYTLGLLTIDGRVKDQGRVFQDLARTYRGKPVHYRSVAPPAPPSERTTDHTWQWLLDWMQWTPPAGSYSG
jgi:hypothetical protein